MHKDLLRKGAPRLWKLGTDFGFPRLAKVGPFGLLLCWQRARMIFVRDASRFVSRARRPICAHNTATPSHSAKEAADGFTYRLSPLSSINVLDQQRSQALVDFWRPSPLLGLLL